MNDSSTLRNRAFFYNLAHISGESDCEFHENFITDVSLDDEVQLHFGSNPDPQSGSRVRIGIGTPDPDHILLCGRMQSLTALVKTCEVQLKVFL